MVSFTPRQIYIRENSHVTHRTGRSLGPKAGLNDSEKRKIFVTEKNRNPNFPSPSPFTIYPLQPSILRHIRLPTSIFFADLLHQKLQLLFPVIDKTIPPKSLSQANNRNSLSLVGANVRTHILHFQREECKDFKQRS